MKHAFYPWERVHWHKEKTDYYSITEKWAAGGNVESILVNFRCYFVQVIRKKMNWTYWIFMNMSDVFIFLTGSETN